MSLKKFISSKIGDSVVDYSSGIRQSFSDFKNLLFSSAGTASGQVKETDATYESYAAGIRSASKTNFDLITKADDIEAKTKTKTKEASVASETSTTKDIAKLDSKLDKLTETLESFDDFSKSGVSSSEFGI